MRRQTIVLGVALSFVFVTAANAMADFRAQWYMNEPSGSTKMGDSSGYGNVGDISNVELTGSVYRFNGVNSHVSVPDNGSLDPIAQDIRITARASLVGPIQDDSYDIVRKGLGSSAGGDWKMEIKNFQNLGAVGKLKCTFRGNVRSSSKTARPDIMDGVAHTLQCIKTDTTIVAVVDGRRFSKTVTVGDIDNSANAMVGAKTPTDDVFNGDLDEVTVEIGEIGP
jgi:hypothetical protein